MPIQKGKKRRRPRHRNRSGYSLAPESGAEPVSRPKVKIMRRGWQGSYRSNLFLGLGLLLFGLVIFLYPLFQKGGHITTVSIVILVGYAGLAGLYFGRAWRQRRT